MKMDFFDDMFDLNHDGKIDGGEFAFAMDFIDGNNARANYDEDERRELLEDAGIDLDDYDL